MWYMDTLGLAWYDQHHLTLFHITLIPTKFHFLLIVTFLWTICVKVFENVYNSKSISYSLQIWYVDTLRAAWYDQHHLILFHITLIPTKFHFLLIVIFHVQWCIVTLFFGLMTSNLVCCYLKGWMTCISYSSIIDPFQFTFIPIKFQLFYSNRVPLIHFIPAMCLQYSPHASPYWPFSVYPYTHKI